MVAHVINPLVQRNGLHWEQHAPGVTLADVGGTYKGRNYICEAHLSGRRCYPLRSEWASVTCGDGDTVYFVAVVAGVETLLILAVVAIVGVAVALSMAPPEAGRTREADPVYDLAGQRNQPKLGKAIEDVYGRPRIWPSYGTADYSQFYGNDQYHFQLFCLGHGSFDVERVQVEDTLADNYQEISYEITPPGGKVTLFPDNVEVSPEVGSIELYGPNEAEYQGPAGPFVANSSTTTTTHLEVDVFFPQGLYRLDDGKLKNYTVSLLFEYRAIDDIGDPLSGAVWETLEAVTKTLGTNTPQRFTFQKDVTSGRYEVRADRTNNANLGHAVGDTATWVGLRAFLPSVRDYGDVTMLSVKSRATNNLNANASNRINVVATRLLPTYDPETGTLAPVDDFEARTATRSPVWAMVNILRAQYGRHLPDAYIDLEHLAAEASAMEAAGVYFDWIYDQSVTVWEAIKLPCFVMRSVPILNGSQVSLVRDKPSSLPTFFINPENTVAGSFALEKKMLDQQANDGLEVEYVDGNSYLPETVTCLLPGEVGNDVRKLRLKGVTDRQQAYALGMYLWARETYENQQVTLTTGLEGFIPTYGDVARVASDIPRWGFSGYVLGIVGNVVELSEDVTFADGEVHQLALRGKTGQDLGPYTVTAGDAPNKVVSLSALPSDQFYFDLTREPPYYVFGVSNVVGEVTRIVNLTPHEQDLVDVTAVVDDPRRHADYGDAPPLDTPATAPSIPDAPIVTGLQVTPVVASLVQVIIAWQPAFGAVNYILETSSDGADWVPVGTFDATNHTLSVVPGTLFVRVAAVNVGIGPFATWTGVVGEATTPPDDVTNLIVSPAFTGTSASIQWTGSPSATSYIVEIYTDTGAGDVLRHAAEVTVMLHVLTVAELTSYGGLTRSIRFDVTAQNSFGLADNPATVLATNTPPPELAGLTSILKTDAPTYVDYTVAWGVSSAQDVSFYRVWGSTAEGFAPGPGNVVFEGLASAIDLRIAKNATGSFGSLHWRVAAVDVWGDETNPSVEQTIQGNKVNLTVDGNKIIDGEGNTLTH